MRKEARGQSGGGHGGTTPYGRQRERSTIASRAAVFLARSPCARVIVSKILAAEEAARRKCVPHIIQLICTRGQRMACLPAPPPHPVSAASQSCPGPSASAPRPPLASPAPRPRGASPTPPAARSPPATAPRVLRPGARTPRTGVARTKRAREGRITSQQIETKSS